MVALPIGFDTRENPMMRLQWAAGEWSSARVDRSLFQLRRTQPTRARHVEQHVLVACSGRSRDCRGEREAPGDGLLIRCVCAGEYVVRRRQPTEADRP